MSRVFGSKEKPVKNASVSASKLKIDTSTLKSSVYINK